MLLLWCKKKGTKSMIKVHLPKFTNIHYYGENYLTNFDHWTTIKTIEELGRAIQNIRIRIAQSELFVRYGVREWQNIAIDRTDLEIIEC